MQAVHADRPCKQAVPTGVQAGRTGELAHIKFCFVIKSIFFKKKLYLVCNCIICGNANFLFLKSRKKYIYIYVFQNNKKFEILEDKRKENIKKIRFFYSKFQQTTRKKLRIASKWAVRPVEQVYLHIYTPTKSKKSTK